MSELVIYIDQKYVDNVVTPLSYMVYTDFNPKDWYEWLPDELNPYKKKQFMINRLKRKYGSITTSKYPKGASGRYARLRNR